ncbi:hypothetical protein DMN77_18815 [Paenibacillus sp. 79R4]|uniref:hypothetical protein n=1 Tax=Paenibacillus sp. 79R4 TaxID=2212847 RepID=UPI0015B920ED|nr:hypothetical protein [Paenibacillus sp. 79R4]NWL89603.1 hypothetical protein [Paenibacillus sp. 79R4]
MSLTKRIQEAVEKLRGFQDDADDAKHTTGEILVSISDFIDDDLDGLINEIDEVADEVESLEEKVAELEEELKELQEGE